MKNVMLIAAAATLLSCGTAFGQYTGSRSGPCPGTLTLTWAGATPSVSQVLLFANSPGAFVIPPGITCSSTVLGLSGSGLQIVVRIPTGPGFGSISGSAGPAVCAGKFQWIEVPSCNTSNVF